MGHIGFDLNIVEDAETLKIYMVLNLHAHNELARKALTRFATTYLNLKGMLKKRF